jgi:L-ascorbate metabolism protein UlaG (beta-lactamase superfamily)
MFRALGATWVLPVHHSTFRLSREPVDEPVRRFLAAAGEERWRVLPTGVGATWHLPEHEPGAGRAGRQEGPA